MRGLHRQEFRLTAMVLSNGRGSREGERSRHLSSQRIVDLEINVKMWSLALELGHVNISLHT